MATAEQIEQVRLYINDPGGATEFLEDSQIGMFIDAQDGDLNRAASELWKVKAARVSEWYLVNIDGAFLSRDQAFDHAMKMSATYASSGGMTNALLTTVSDNIERSSEF